MLGSGQFCCNIVFLPVSYFPKHTVQISLSCFIDKESGLKAGLPDYYHSINYRHAKRWWMLAVLLWQTKWWIWGLNCYTKDLAQSRYLTNICQTEEHSTWQIWNIIHSWVCFNRNNWFFKIFYLFFLKDYILYQRLVNFLCKRPDSKYFRLWDHRTLLL